MDAILTNAVNAAAHYEDRRGRLVALGANDEMIQRWVFEAVDRGISAGDYLKQIEGYLVGQESCDMTLNRLFRQLDVRRG